MSYALLALQFLLLAVLLSGEAPPPIFTPVSGTFQHAVVLEMAAPEPGEQVFYTTTGITPTYTSTLYTAPIILSRHASVNHDPDPLDTNLPRSPVSYSVKAFAVQAGLPDSLVVNADYVIDRVETYFNLSYASAPPGNCSNKHLLDIYRPRGQVNTPVVFFVHGGAWREGDKNIYLELGNTLAGDYQLTTVIINYRLSNADCFAIHPDHIQDVADAFQWVHTNIAAYGGDPDNIHLFGQSAGGHLVSLLASDARYLQAVGLSAANIRSVTSMSGAYNLSAFAVADNNPLQLSDLQVQAYRALFITVFGNTFPQTLVDASPGSYISSTLPPLQIIRLAESPTFFDMPGFRLDAGNFYTQVLNLSAPPVTLNTLNETDIPQEILVMDFPDFTGDVDGHYEEIYAINTVNWNSRSTRMVVDFVKANLPLQLTVPNGGERWALNENNQITWSSQIQTGDVRLEYSLDDGANWFVLAEAAPNTGSYTWLTPRTPSPLARVRISAAGYSDMSTQVFALGPTFWLHLPMLQQGP